MKKVSTQEILNKELLTEREILNIKKRFNSGKENYNSPSLIVKEEYLITPEQTEKGIKWLMNLWKSPTGKERKNNPFGYREEDILQNFSHFSFTGFINLATYHQYQAGFSNYQALYRVYSKEGRSFEYHLEAGDISIVG